MKTKYPSVKEFMNDVNSGVVDGSKLSIILDNACTYFYIIDENEDVEIKIKETNGYHDALLLYCLLFPDADVEWC